MHISFKVISFFVFFLIMFDCAPGRYVSPLEKLPEAERQKIEAEFAYYANPKTSELVGALNLSGDLPDLANKYFEADVRERITHDPIIDLFADTLCYYYMLRDRTPENDLMLWYIKRYGIIMPSRYDYKSWVSGRNLDDRLNAKFRSRVEEVDSLEEYLKFGVKRNLYKSKYYYQAITVFEQFLEMSKFSKHYYPSEEFVLEGKFLIPVFEPTLYMSLEGKEVYISPIEKDNEGRFSIKLTAPEKSGKYIIYIRHQQNKEMKTPIYDGLLYVPIYIGMKEPSKPDAYLLNPPPNPKYYSLWAEKLLASYNSERKKYGLKPLILSEKASQAAKEIVKELQYKNVEEVVEDIRPGLLEKEIDLDEFSWSQSCFSHINTIAIIHNEHPSHKWKIFNSDFTHVGFGFVKVGQMRYRMIRYLYTLEDDKSKSGKATLQKTKE